MHLIKIFIFMVMTVNVAEGMHIHWIMDRVNCIMDVSGCKIIFGLFVDLDHCGGARGGVPDPVALFNRFNWLKADTRYAIPIDEHIFFPE